MTLPGVVVALGLSLGTLVSCSSDDSAPPTVDDAWSACKSAVSEQVLERTKAEFGGRESASIEEAGEGWTVSGDLLGATNDAAGPNLVFTCELDAKAKIVTAVVGSR